LGELREEINQICLVIRVCVWRSRYKKNRCRETILGFRLFLTKQRYKEFYCKTRKRWEIDCDGL
jgi:hypothetical protein